MGSRFAVLVAACVIGSGCGTKHGGGGDGGGGNGDANGPDAFAGPYSDLPVSPVIDANTPAGAPGLFGGAPTTAPTGGPCMVEPEVGTLYPQNWLRPRFTWIATGSENLFEISIAAANEVNPLVVYTTATTWTMPADLWALLSAHIVDQPITVTVVGATYDATSGTLTAGPELGSSGNIAIAPAQAPGAIVYWTTSDGTNLRGFHIGDESVTTIVTPTDASTACIGCHSSTPDGTYVGFSASADGGNGDPAALELLTADGTHTAPPFLTDSAKALMARTYQELPTFSANHWTDGDHTALAMYPVNNNSQIIWVDLEATAQTQGVGWDVLPRGAESGSATGEAGAASASWAHTSDTILYAADVGSGTVGAGVTVTDGDLETVAYNGRAGGTPVPVVGANTTTYNEYYPTFSSDDRYIAFNRVAAGATSYNDAQAEVFVIPAGGGTPISLAANAPPACSGRTSPGVTNSWPKWAPATTDVGTKRYYWLTFSSTRSAASNPQLYVTPIVDDGGTITTYPALYLWNQPADENNHTPAWDNFDVPIASRH